MARVPYVDPEDLPADSAHLVRTSMASEELPDRVAALLDDDALNVHRAVGNNLPLLRHFRRTNGAFFEESGLTARQRELVILTVARLAEAPYEWQQHVRHGLGNGLSTDEIRAIADGRADAFEGEERALVEYVEAHVRRSVTDADHEALRAHFDAATVVGVAMMAGHYLGLAHTLDALGVETETEFVGWDLERL